MQTKTAEKLKSLIGELLDEKAAKLREINNIDSSVESLTVLVRDTSGSLTPATTTKETKPLVITEGTWAVKVQNFLAINGPATIREIADHFGATTSNIYNSAIRPNMKRFKKDGSGFPIKWSNR